MNLGVIPARGGSKGCPGKNLRLLGGIPLIVHTIRAAQQARGLEAFVVSTDDEAIAETARKAGASVPFLRPAELATDQISVWPAVLHATKHWENQSGQSVDVVVLLQPTSPLRTAMDIDACLEKFSASEADICVSVVAPHDSPYFNMVEPVPTSPEFVQPCSPAMRMRIRRQESPPVYALNGAVYVVRRRFLQGLTNQFELERIAFHEMPRARSVDIDTIEDLELAEWWLERARQTDTLQPVPL